MKLDAFFLDEILSINPIHYIETVYHMHRLDVILTSHPALHRKSAVLEYTLSDHYLIYTHMEFENTKPSESDHITVKFSDMKKFDIESFSNDLILCDILNRFHDNDDISWERWKLAYTEICDKHGPMKSLRLKKPSKSMNDP